MSRKNAIWSGKFSSLLWLVLGLLPAIVDFFTGPYINFPVLFLFPIGLAAWFSGRAWGVALAVLLPLIRPVYYMEFWGQSLGTPIFLSNAAIKILVFVVFAELIHRIAAARRFQAQVLECLPVGMWILDRGGRIVRANPAGRDIWGGMMKTDWGEGRGAGIRWHASGQPVEYPEWAVGRALGSGETVLNEVLDIEAAGGARKTILNSATPVRDERGRIAGALLVQEDITAAKQLEQEREDLIRSLEDAMRNLKILRGLLPICASCKKIRGEGGSWQNVEIYIQGHSEAEFSHGICPDCYPLLYPEYSRRRPPS